jgi:hypothetical protein
VERTESRDVAHDESLKKVLHDVGELRASPLGAAPKGMSVKCSYQAVATEDAAGSGQTAGRNGEARSAFGRA